MPVGTTKAVKNGVCPHFHFLKKKARADWRGQVTPGKSFVDVANLVVVALAVDIGAVLVGRGLQLGALAPGQLAV